MVGRAGHFYELCSEAQKLQQSDVELTKMDYKFHFFPWWGAQEYRLEGKFPHRQEHLEYFESLEAEYDISLDREQRNWYVKKALEQGERMKAEFPSVPAEAFEKLLQGAIFARQLMVAREEKRVASLPHVRGNPVNVFWDLGFNDINAMWFHQRVGAWDHFVDYYEHRLVDMTHYIEVLHELSRKNGYQYGTMFLPHDGRQHHISAISGSAADILRRNGFRVRVLDRPLHKVPSIEATRKKFGECRFDKDKCDQGLIHLENYKWKWDEKGETYRKTPIHDASSNGADAFQTFGWWSKTSGDSPSFAKQQAKVLDFSRVPGYNRRSKVNREYNYIL